MNWGRRKSKKPPSPIRFWVSPIRFTLSPLLNYVNTNVRMYHKPKVTVVLRGAWEGEGKYGVLCIEREPQKEP